MKLKPVLTVDAAKALDIILNKGHSAFDAWIEDQGVDPFKRPIKFMINNSEKGTLTIYQ